MRQLRVPSLRSKAVPLSLRFFSEDEKREVFSMEKRRMKKNERMKRLKEREEKEQERKEEGEKEKVVNILVQGLDGKHLSMKIAGSTRVSALCGDLSKVTGIPMDAFYLTRQAKVLQNDDELWLEMDERLWMRERLRVGMDGDWTCQHCGRQGCWVTKVRCVASLSLIRLVSSLWMGIQMCLGGSELRPGNKQRESGHKLLGELGLVLGQVGSLWVRKHHHSHNNKANGLRIRDKRHKHSRGPLRLHKKRNRTRFCWQL